MLRSRAMKLSGSFSLRWSCICTQEIKSDWDALSLAHGYHHFETGCDEPMCKVNFFHPGNFLPQSASCTLRSGGQLEPLNVLFQSAQMCGTLSMLKTPRCFHYVSFWLCLFEGCKAPIPLHLLSSWGTHPHPNFQVLHGFLVIHQLHSRSGSPLYGYVRCYVSTALFLPWINIMCQASAPKSRVLNVFPSPFPSFTFTLSLCLILWRGSKQ